MRNLPDTRTAEELIAILEGLEPNTLVAFASDYGDRRHTQQIHFIRGDLEPRTIDESAYSDSGWAIANQEGDEDDQSKQTIHIMS